MLPQRLVELIDELDQEIRSPQTARALGQRLVLPELATLAVRGLKHLLDGEPQQAERVFEALVEEIRDRTLSLGRP